MTQPEDLHRKEPPAAELNEPPTLGELIAPHLTFIEDAIQRHLVISEIQEAIQRHQSPLKEPDIIKIIRKHHKKPGEEPYDAAESIIKALDHTPVAPPKPDSTREPEAPPPTRRQLLEALDPSWLQWNQGTIPHMVHTIRTEQKPELIPMVADALEDAGCTNSPLLNYLRTPDLEYQQNSLIWQSLEYQEVGPQLTWWDTFYRDRLDRNLDLDNLKLPQRNEQQEKAYQQLLIVEKNLTLREITKIYQDLKINLEIYDFREGQRRYRSCWPNAQEPLTDQDWQELFARHDRITHDSETQEEIPENQRTTYAVFTRDNQKPDQDLDLSADDLDNLPAHQRTKLKAKGYEIRGSKLSTQNLYEALLHTLYFYLTRKSLPEEQQYLNRQYFQNVSGSCESDGDVPNLCWSSGRFYVDGWFPSYLSGSLRARSILSLAAEPS